MTNFLKALGVTDMAPNAASRCLSKYYDSVLKPLGLEYRSYRCTEGRFVGIDRVYDDNDGYDDISGNEKPSSISSIDKGAAAYRAKYMTMMAGNDGQLSFPQKPSLSSISSLSSSENEEPSSDRWKPLGESGEKSPFPV